MKLFSELFTNNFFKYTFVTFELKQTIKVRKKENDEMTDNSQN